MSVLARKAHRVVGATRGGPLLRAHNPTTTLSRHRQLPHDALGKT